MPDADCLSRQFGALISAAIETLNTHTNDRDLSAVCGCAWPCERAVLAEHNLAAL